MEKLQRRDKKEKVEESLGDFDFNDDETALLKDFFEELRQHLTLPKRQRALMENDFMAAVRYYITSGVPLNEALEKISPCNLGGFYAHPAKRWYPLDNAAKLYPLSMKREQMSVFRLAAYMNEPVVPEILQMALTFTIKRFPSFATTIRNGIFWNYLDSTKKRFEVELESGVPCRPMRISASGSQSFRVLYYKDRISVEFFHILTDGMGGMTFVKTLIAEYLRLLGHEIPYGEGVLDIGDVPREDEVSDDFVRVRRLKEDAENNFRPAIKKGIVATQMSGELSNIRPCRVIHFEVEADRLKELAKSKNVTITAFMIAVLFVADKFATEENGGNVQIQVPVNMRQYHETRTLRNFSLQCKLSLPLSAITGVEDILQEVSAQLTRNSSEAAMNRQMNAAVNWVRALTLIPLVLKVRGAEIGYEYVSDLIFSTTFSNMGVVKIPEEMKEFIYKFEGTLSSGSISRAASSIITYKNKAVITISKMTTDPSFEEKVYQILKDYGLEPIATGSILYEG